MLLSLQNLQAPAYEPVSLDMIKSQVGVDVSFTNDDAMLSMFGIAAREFCEKYTRRAFLPQQWLLTLDHFPTYYYSGTTNPSARRDWNSYSGSWGGMTIALPKPNCISVDSIKYLDATGSQQTLDPATYRYDMNSAPARLVPAPGLCWPLNTVYLPGSVQITYTTGSYATIFAVPQSICLAILLLVSHWYNNRESASVMNMNEIPFGVKALLDHYKVTVLDYQEVV